MRDLNFRVICIIMLCLISTLISPVTGFAEETKSAYELSPAAEAAPSAGVSSEETSNGVNLTVEENDENPP